MRYYPLFLDISRARCLVVGAGSVGRRKISTLQKANAMEIIVLDSLLTQEEFETLYHLEYGEIPEVSYFQRSLLPDDLANVRLAFLATSDTVQNGLFAELCHEKNVLCNVIEESVRGDFIVPAHLQFENLIVALSTSGASPALAKALKDDLETWLDERYVPYVNLLEHIRKLFVSPDFNATDRAFVFRTLVEKTCRERTLILLEQKKKAELQTLMKEKLPTELYMRIDWDFLLDN